MKKVLALALAILVSSCTLTSEQRADLIGKEMDARLQLAKQPIVQAEEAKNLVVFSQDRTMPQLPPSDVDKYLDAVIKAGIIGLGAYGIHELSDGGNSTNNTVNNYAAQGE